MLNLIFGADSVGVQQLHWRHLNGNGFVFNDPDWLWFGRHPRNPALTPLWEPALFGLVGLAA